MSEEIGHNNPPSQIQFAEETTVIINDWLYHHPVIQTAEEAKEYKLLRDRGKACLADMEDEYRGKTRPLQGQINVIRDEYRMPTIFLNNVLGEGDKRANVWIKQEAEKRRAITEEAQRKVREAEAESKAASDREQAASEEAAMGVETDILAASSAASAALNALERSNREAARAERNEGVKITGGFRRALGTRERIEFVITDPMLVVQNTLGWSERLYSALESDVRQYYKQTGKVPKGVQLITTEKVQ